MNKHVKPLTVLAAFLAAPTAFAGFGSTPQQFTSDAVVWNPGDGAVKLTFDPFNDAGGTRELTSIEFWTSIVVDSDGGLLENDSPVAVEAGDYVFGFNVNHLTSWDNGLPMFSFGASSTPTPTVDLGASDGVEGSGPDTHLYTWGLKALDIFDFITILPEDESRFLGNDPLSLTITPTVNPTLPFPPPALNFTLVNHSEFVEYGLIYNYREVPAPASSLALIGAGALCARRRRS